LSGERPSGSWHRRDRNKEAYVRVLRPGRPRVNRWPLDGGKLMPTKYQLRKGARHANYEMAMLHATAAWLTDGLRESLSAALRSRFGPEVVVVEPK
jgi:hypothetical protein